MAKDDSLINDLLKISAAAVAAKAASDISAANDAQQKALIEQRAHNKVQAAHFEQARVDQEKMNTNAREDRERQIIREFKEDAAREQQQALEQRQRTLEAVNTIASLDLKIHHRHLKLVENISIEKSISLKAAADLFRSQMEANGTASLLPDFSGDESEVITTLMNKFALDREHAVSALEKAAEEGLPVAGIAEQYRVVRNLAKQTFLSWSEQMGEKIDANETPKLREIKLSAAEIQGNAAGILRDLPIFSKNLDRIKNGKNATILFIAVGVVFGVFQLICANFLITGVVIVACLWVARSYKVVKGRLFSGTSPEFSKTLPLNYYNLLINARENLGGPSANWTEAQHTGFRAELFSLLDKIYCDRSKLTNDVLIFISAYLQLNQTPANVSQSYPYKKSEKAWANDMTPLEMAINGAEPNSDEAMRAGVLMSLLLKNGAEIKQNSRVMKILINQKNPLIMKLLLDAGADLSGKYEGKTLIRYADVHLSKHLGTKQNGDENAQKIWKLLNGGDWERGFIEYGYVGSNDQADIFLPGDENAA